MEEDEHKELQLLPAAPTTTIPGNDTNYPVRPVPSEPPPPPPSIIRYNHHSRRSPNLGVVDLQLSISVNNNNNNLIVAEDDDDDDDDVAERERRRHRGKSGVAALRWEAAEQIRMAAVEKAYAERVREMTRREIETAQSEFARARHVWQRAREEVERAERMKERATAAAAAAGTCMEITCHSCRQRFRPNN